MPFIHFFNINSNSKIIGYPHSGVRYWDLRYFEECSLFKNKDYLKPKPDYVAAIGPISKKYLVEENYPKDEVIKVESLRHMHLLDRKITPKKDKIKLNLKILILGDYSNEINLKMLDFLEKTSYFLPKNTNYVFKPHPSKTNFNHNLKNIKLNISKDSFDTLLKKIDIVFTSDQTTSSSDAYFSGVPVFIYLNQHLLNLSPLRGFPDVDFIYNNPKHFADRIIIKSKKVNIVDLNSSFYLNKDLKYWNNLLMNIS